MENEPLQSAPQPDVSELKAQYESLHSTVIALTLLVIVVSGTLWIFLMRQARAANADIEVIKPSYTNVMAQYERTRPVIDETVKKLQEFGRTNADFAPILNKYRLTSSPTSAPPQAPAKKQTR